jgi:hypothetical protein
MNIKDLANNINRVLIENKLLVEVNLKKLMRDCPSIVRKRSEGYNVSFKIRMIKNGKDKFYFHVKKPGTKQYNVNFEFVGNTEDKLKDDVRVSCNCGYFKFWGPDYNARENDYSLRKMSNLQPPDIRDPDREHNICKHIYAASKVLVDYIKTSKE